MPEYGAGGGITWDSALTDEYEETLLKAKLLTVVRPDFQLLESFRLENGEYYLFENHMERLMQAAEYFSFSILESDIKKKLVQFAKNHPSGIYKVRLVVSKSEAIEVSGQMINEITNPVSIKLAQFTNCYKSTICLF